MKFTNILTELWCQPWVILPAVHQKLCEIVDAHISGDAHKDGGIAGMFGEEEEAEAFAYEVIDGVAVLPIHGVLGLHVGSLEKCSGVTDIADISAELKRAAADPAVSGLLLDVNSPGGSTSGIPELAAEIAQFSVAKPVVAFTDSMIASAAYWLASGSDIIVASQSAEIGSIGVYMAWLDVSRAYEMQGLRRELIKRGRMKGVGIEGTSLTEEAREMLQQSVDQVYDWFVGHVSLFREDLAAEDMEGQVFFAQQAKDKDFIDMVGTREDALEQARELAKEQK